MVMTDTQFWITLLISIFLAILIVNPMATKALRRFGIYNNKSTPFLVQIISSLLLTLVWLGIFYLIRFLLTGATDRATLFH